MSHATAVVNIVVGWILIFATFVCYSFQIIKICQMKSARGISFMSFWFCCTTSFLNLLSAAVLDWEGLARGGSTTAILATVNQWTTLILFGALTGCYFFIIFQYMYFYMKENSPNAAPLSAFHGVSPIQNRQSGNVRIEAYDSPDETTPFAVPGMEDENDQGVSRRRRADYHDRIVPDDLSDSSTSTETEEEDLEEEPLLPEPKWRIGLTILLFFLLLYVVVILSAWGFLYLPLFGLEEFFGKATAAIYAEVLGYAAAVIVFVQWLPQILTTLLNRGAGSFSIVMLILMMIGAVVNVAFLIIAHQNFANIASYIVSFVQQLVLFGLLVFFMTIGKCRECLDRIRDRKNLSMKQQISDSEEE